MDDIHAYLQKQLKRSDQLYYRGEHCQRLCLMDRNENIILDLFDEKIWGAYGDFLYPDRFAAVRSVAMDTLRNTMHENFKHKPIGAIHRACEDIDRLTEPYFAGKKVKFTEVLKEFNHWKYNPYYKPSHACMFFFRNPHVNDDKRSSNDNRYYCSSNDGYNKRMREEEDDKRHDDVRGEENQNDSEGNKRFRDERGDERDGDD